MTTAHLLKIRVISQSRVRPSGPMIKGQRSADASALLRSQFSGAAPNEAPAWAIHPGSKTFAATDYAHEPRAGDQVLPCDISACR